MVDDVVDNSNNAIIGHGTWLDKLAHEMIKREKKLGRSTEMLVVESGLGASGIPHIGSLGDAVRAYGIKLALGNLGYDSKLIAYSDDLDGLRKIPQGLPDSLEEHLGKPVSLIPDPFSTHDSYGMHMSSILLDGLDSMGVKYEFRRAYDTYRKGLLEDQIHTILTKSSQIGKQIEDMVGQSKYRDNTLPYFPVCASCDKLYTARATQYVESERKVLYECCDVQMNQRVIRGCGHTGESDIRRDLGKLAWKVEFAARWTAFDVRFEAYGKDIMDSVKVNDWVAENILGFAHPHHAKYEMFLDKGGKKISKSEGNVLTAQRWLEFATPQSVLLLLYKRIAGARELGISGDVPSLMDEFNELEDIYFGKRVRKDLKNNPAKLAKSKGLYLYANLLNPPQEPSIHVSYMLVVKLAQIYKNNPDRSRHVISKLLEYGAITESDEQIEHLVNLAARYADEFADEKSEHDNMNNIEQSIRDALLEIAQLFDSIKDTRNVEGGLPDQIQTTIYNTAKSNDIPPKDIFSVLYGIILGSSRGPRIGPLIVDIGVEHVAQLIRERVS